MTEVQQYLKILDNKFSGLSLGKGLFYSWDKGLRFDLQVGETNTTEYFKNVHERSITLFESVFKDNAPIFLILNEYKWKKRKIRFKNFVFRQVKDLQKEQVHYRTESNLYEPGDKFLQAVIKTTVDKVHYHRILKAISHTDFPTWEPRLDKYGFLTSKEVYFIDINSCLIFNMYDDRGLDIISPEIKALEPIYSDFNDWLLDYDRELIDKQMKK